MSDARCFKFELNDIEVDNLCLNSNIGFEEATTAALLAHNLFWEWMNDQYDDAITLAHDLNKREGQRFGALKRSEIFALIMKQYRKYMNQIVKNTDMEGNLWEIPSEK